VSALPGAFRIVNGYSETENKINDNYGIINYLQDKLSSISKLICESSHINARKEFHFKV
jgi:hypothetical protein